MLFRSLFFRFVGPYSKDRDFERNLIRPSSNESAALLASKSEYLPFDDRRQSDPYNLEKPPSRRRNDSARDRRRNRFEPEVIHIKN